MQNVKNHRRFSPLYHFIALPLALAAFILSCIMLVHSMCGHCPNQQQMSKQHCSEMKCNPGEKCEKSNISGEGKQVIIKKMITMEHPPIHHEGKHKMPAAIFFILSILAIIGLVNGRASALKAQNRAIRAEESLRHFILSGKVIDPKLRLGQIIALRFASDDELLSLTEKAVSGNLSSKEIKAQIQHWRADNHRV